MIRNVRRRGSVIPLFAVLLIPLLGMLAFSIDIGYMALVRTDLQTAADAAALAGAEKLQGLYVQYTAPGQTQQSTLLTTATTNTAGSPMNTAERFASYNKAGNVPITVRDQDVTFGFTDAQGAYHANYNGLGLGGGFPNTITVITRRDQLANSPLSLFFGPVFGLSSKELTATASATVYSGDISSLQVIPGVNAHILPVALDVNVWNAFYTTGLSPDGTIHQATNGSPQLQVYPTTTNTPGSFGLLDIGVPSNNAPAFRNWILNGQTPNDVAYLTDPNNNLLPVSTASPKNWKCGPGLTSALLASFQAEMGVPNCIPLFQPVSVSPYQAASDTGQNATYAIVGFVGVTITHADGNGTNMNISIQPCSVVDPTAVIGKPTPAGTQTSEFGATTMITTFISAKLTQ